MQKFRRVLKDPELREDQNVDRNNIVQQIKLVYCLRTMKIILSILLISYFSGILWFIYSIKMIEWGQNHSDDVTEHVHITNINFDESAFPG